MSYRKMFNFVKKAKYYVASSVFSITVAYGYSIQSPLKSSFCEFENQLSTSNSDDNNNVWVPFYAPSGHTYYYNTKTGETSWNLPVQKETWPPQSKWNYNWDSRQESDSHEPSSHVSHVIVMVRHGQYTTVRNEEGINIEALTQIGREQTAVTGERLDLLLKSRVIPPIHNIYYSTLPRAKETFEILKSKLCDHNIHSFEPCTMIQEAVVYYPDPPSKTWLPSKSECEIDGLRALAAFKTYFHRASSSHKMPYSTVLVTHGNMIRYLIMQALQLPPEAWLRVNVRNASITIIEIRSDGCVSLKTVGMYTIHSL